MDRRLPALSPLLLGFILGVLSAAEAEAFVSPEFDLLGVRRQRLNRSERKDIYILAFKYSLYEYFGAKVYTWVQEPIGFG